MSWPSDLTGVVKAKKWLCKKCGFENKSTAVECKQCGHEPTTGRRDVHPEGRAYTPPSED